MDYDGDGDYDLLVSCPDKPYNGTFFFENTEGDAKMELNGKLYPVKPNTAILIKPGVRHRAVGKMTIINIPIPAFDPNDEWFD